MKGAYIGLLQWPGIKTDGFHVGEDKINFKTFWKQCGNIKQMRNMQPYKKGIIPENLHIYSVSTDFKYTRRAVASRVAKHLIEMNK